MTLLRETVTVERRFARSARIDADLNGTPPLTGYVMQPSVRKALDTMAQAVAEGQAAFTWTGPYGGGKSCAALLVGNLVGGKARQRKVAQEIAGPELVEAFANAFPGKAGWKVIALTGRRAPLREELASAAAITLGWTEEKQREASGDDKALSEALREAASENGLLILVDELGKFFEHAALDGGDIHLLQDLAEHAARGASKLVLVGVLHQSFAQYAGRLSRSARDEWAKIQGRFLDIPFAAGPDEVAALLARAISADSIPDIARTTAGNVARSIAERRPVDTDSLADTLAGAWPLHPATALILGPVSRQRFAQNERSVFGFLTSAEPCGFQSYLDETSAEDAGAGYAPDRLWDYLIANFGLELAAGQDGARVSLAMEAIERASVHSAAHGRIAKIAALIELFRNGSGLVVSDAIIGACAPDLSESERRALVDDLVDRAVLMRQPRLGGYALFAGTDFDLEEAITKLRERIQPEAIVDLPAKLGIGPVAAKRHYFEKGALRTFDVVLELVDAEADELEAWVEKCSRAVVRRKAPGAILVLMPDAHVAPSVADRAAKLLAIQLAKDKVTAAAGVARQVYMLREHVADLFALDRVEAAHPQLEGDRIARRELQARRAHTVEAIRHGLLSALQTCRWWAADKRRSELDGRALAFIASDVADKAYDQAPVLHSELLYRDRPSSSAMAAARGLAHAMVLREEDELLGFESFPAELGLHLTVLKPFGLHREVAPGSWRFTNPATEGQGSSLAPAWAELEKPGSKRLSDLYATWALPPFGLKRGVMPILTLAFLLANRDSTAVYVDGYFQAAFDTTFVDRLFQAPAQVEIRAIARTERETAFLARLAELLSAPDTEVEPNALGVASALFARFRLLPEWSQRTTSLNANVTEIRDVVIKANDPEELLFVQLPDLLAHENDRAGIIAAAVQQTEAAYPDMLARLRRTLAERLATDAESFAGIGMRATTAAGVMADLRFDAFAMRVGAFEADEGDIEGLASLLVHKPPRNWSDRDHDMAVLELAKLAQRFREAEAMAELRGREPTAQAISLMIGLDPRAIPLRRAFHVSNRELEAADVVANSILETLQQNGLSQEIELAAIARAFERLHLRAVEAAE